MVQNQAREIVLRLLLHISRGQLIIREGRQVMSFGNDPEFCATLYIHDPACYRRILTGGTIGAGESYVDGLWDSDDLTMVIRIMVANQELLLQLENKAAWLVAPFRRLHHLLKRNSRRGAKRNILAHYDLGNDMYQSFLDPTMMYSAAIYPAPESSLVEASRHKLDLVCSKLQLQPSDRVIEIGSGWGGFALHAAQNYGCHVTTTTISDAQYAEAGRRIEAAGLEERITLFRQDYRDLTGQYDKLVSIEMIEAVGYRQLPAFIGKCSALLKPDGLMLLQAITLKDQLYAAYLKGVDFIQQHVFPGGCLVSNQHLFQLISRNSDMVVRQLDDYGFDYARTLKDWRNRFHAAAGQLDSQGYDARFRRLWEFYFCYCEGGFRERSISVIHLLAGKPEQRGALSNHALAG
jgi:cyclopropane-fatty-acyl-phospholipid synthase